MVKIATEGVQQTNNLFKKTEVTKMTYTFDSIAGYTQEKKELMALCNLFNNRKEYEKKGARLPKGIIFYGDIGNGKTLFAKVLACPRDPNTLSKWRSSYGCKSVERPDLDHSCVKNQRGAPIDQEGEVHSWN